MRAGDVLAAEDYRLLVQVLETVDQAPDLDTFKRRLAQALRHWFGYRSVAVADGGSLLDSEGVTSMFGVRLDCEPHGSLYLAVVPDDDRAPARATALLRALRRHLTPIASRLLADDQTPARQPPWHLTARERQVTALVADGLTNQQIAARLVVGVDTVKKHLTRVLTETGCDSRTQLAVRWHRRTALAARPRQSPPDIGRFTGRADELATLDELVAARDRGEPAVAVVEGMAGTGKTALAAHWASLRHDAFDLDLFLDLKGCRKTSPVSGPVSPADALGTLLRSIGVPDEAIPPTLEQRSALFRSALHERGRPLLVLDDAKDAEQVRPLLPGHDVVVLVTSRTQLRGLVACDGVLRVPLCEYSEKDALDLLAATIGPDRVDAEPDAATRLIDLCGRLPLAVALAAERAARGPNLPLATHARELSDEPNRLRALSFPTDPHTDLEAALCLSTRLLRPAATRVFSLLGLHPDTELTGESVAALCGVPRAEAASALDDLVAAHLLTPSGHGRFRLPQLVHVHLRSLTGERG